MVLYSLYKIKILNRTIQNLSQINQNLSCLSILIHTILIMKNAKNYLIWKNIPQISFMNIYK
jgi:hypothetical protein